MTGGEPFQIRRGVLQFHRPPDGGRLVFLCWPLIVYRVVAPMLRVRHLNIIEKVVLALCQAGVRQPAELAAKIHQRPELCEHVLRQLRDGGRIDRFGVPTDEGREALATNRIGEEPELIVTHVFQDPVTGQLWPRAALDLKFGRVHGVRDGQARLRLDTAGSPRPVSAHILDFEPGPVRTGPPTAQEIIDAVGAQRQAELVSRAERLTDNRGGRSPGAQTAERDLQALSTELTLPHETAVHRVLDVGPPMAEYLLVWLRDGEEPGRGPRALDPFGLDPNPFVRRLVAERIRTDPGLAKVVTGAADLSEARDIETYRIIGATIRRAAETRLVQQLGPELRRRPEALKLLLGLEESAARGGESGVESVARDAYRLYEYLFRRLVAEYPPPDRPSWAVGRGRVPAEEVLAALTMAAADIGLDELPSVYLNDLGKVGGYPQRVRGGGKACDARGYPPQLLPYVLIAAFDAHSAHRAEHPLRAMARDRPSVLTELNELRLLRNRGTHETRDATVEDDIDWCRRLAIAAARLLVSMPPPPSERN